MLVIKAVFQNSKRRYIDHSNVWEETPKIRPELPTPPFGEVSELETVKLIDNLL